MRFPRSLDAPSSTVKEVLAKVRASGGKLEQGRSFLAAFRSQLDGIDFFNRVMDFEATDPQLYVNECSNGIFSLLKRNTTRRATARSQPPPSEADCLSSGNKPKAIEQAGATLPSLHRLRAFNRQFVNDSLMTLRAKTLSPAERNDLVKARDAALVSIHGFADGWKSVCREWCPSNDGRGNYNYVLKNI